MPKPKNVCKGCYVNEGNGKHTCPFKIEITGNDEKCNCCDECRSGCCQEI